MKISYRDFAIANKSVLEEILNKFNVRGLNIKSSDGLPELYPASISNDKYVEEMVYIKINQKRYLTSKQIDKIVDIFPFNINEYQFKFNSINDFEVEWDGDRCYLPSVLFKIQKNNKNIISSF
tara:strand:+ start:21677 stop:22045 length:369 start_codon:yes stop_codon:yes gene_type:complete